MSMTMKGLKLLSEMALANAKKEANSACIFMGYQPKVPKKAKEIKKQKNG